MPLFDTTHTISLQTAIDMTRRYRENKVTILQPSLSSTPVLHDAETFNREAIDRLLAQAGCQGVRIYYGMDETLSVHAILVGVDQNGNDILPIAATGDEEEGIIVEEGRICPPHCATDPSPLHP